MAVLIDHESHDNCSRILRRINTFFNSAYDWHLYARGPFSDTEKNLPFAIIVIFVFLV